LRGGLGISVVLVGALLAASTGIVGATVVAMGMIALPTMLRAGYDPRVASGIVCTAGTLGQIIPPSTLLIILADVMSNAYQQAQYEQGKFAVEALSVGQFFAAAILPGFMLVLLYLIYILLRGVVRPQDMPPAALDLPRPDRSEVLGAIVPPVLLIVAVLGAILGGVATPDRSRLRRRHRRAADGRTAHRAQPEDHPHGRRSAGGSGHSRRPVSGAAAAQRLEPVLAGRWRCLCGAHHHRCGWRFLCSDGPHSARR
jgi:hypothetical protein